MLSPHNQALLDELIRTNVNVEDGEIFTVFYQTRFGSNLDKAYAAYDGEKVIVDLYTYTRLADVRCPDIEDVFMKMQGDFWSPRGEARPIIKELGLRHTSMSCGDLVQQGDEYFICAPMGFIKVEAENQLPHHIRI